MRWYRGLESIVERDVDLSRLTWFKVGGPARWLVRPRQEAELAEVLRRGSGQGVPVRVLGLGANLLVADSGITDAVVRLDQPAFGAVRIDGRRLIVGGGADMAKLVRDVVRGGLWGLECLAGIPGTVGGCVRMNAGGKFGEIAEVVRRVRVVNERGEARDLDREDIPFGYRYSGLAGQVVAQVEMELAEGDREALVRRYDEIWAYKRASQPLAAKSAGCIFKNPAGASAGALIERAGCKGLRNGSAWVSQHHANFILADADGTASDVLAVIEQVQQRVWERFGVALELEVEVWGAESEFAPGRAELAAL